MATKSILKNVDVKDRKMGKSLVVALEQAEKKHAKNVVISRTYSDIRGSRIKDIFGNKA